MVREEAGYEAFKVEQHGIDVIPEDERPMSPSGLFWLWAGAMWNVEFLVYGALIMSFGLSFTEALTAIVLGNLAYAFLGMASLAGPEAGTTAIMVSRGPFGQNGNRLVALFNWLTQVGFEIEGLALIVIIVQDMFSRGHHTMSNAVTAVVIVLAVLVQFVVPFLGHATITKLLKWLSFVFIVVFAVMAVLVIPNVHLPVMQGGKASTVSLAGWTTAVVLIISAGGLGWTENGNDYSRYLPRNTPKRRTFLAAALGGAIPSVLLEVLGAAAFSASSQLSSQSGTQGIVAALPTSFASWFFWPFLILAIPQLLAINSLDLYSSGVTLQALGVPVKRWGAVIIDTVVAGAGTAVVIFTNNFFNDLSGFLDYIVVWLAPWFGIVAVDYLLRRGRYSGPDLAARRGGIYWRRGGVNIRAIVALAIGMGATLMWTFAQYYNPAYVGPISSRTGGSDLSWLIGIVVGGLVYGALEYNQGRADT